MGTVVNREKVMQGIKLCVQSGDFCKECPYHKTKLCLDNLHNDAFAILKEHDEWFQCEEGFINWISAYYSAPKRFVNVEEHEKNVETWKMFFDNMRIAKGEEPKYSNKE